MHFIPFGPKPGDSPGELSFSQIKLQIVFDIFHRLGKQIINKH